MKIRSVTIVLLALCCLRINAQFSVCSYQDPATGKNYDLNALAQQFSSTPAVTTPDAGGYKYYINPCQAVRGNSQCNVLAGNMGVCQLDGNGNDFTLGTWNGATIAAYSQGEGVTVTLPLYAQRGANVSYICDQNAGVGNFKWVTIPPGPAPYIWTFEWRTSYACPTGGGGGGGGGGGSGGLAGGWIFLIVLLSVTVVYFVAGAVVNKFYFKKERAEIIPNSNFWLSLPGLVKDGHLYIYNSIRRLFFRGSYEQV